MKKTVYLAALCLGTGLALPASTEAQQSQQFGGQQQMGQQQLGQQAPGQMTGQHRLTEQRIRNFFDQAQNILQRTARTQDPGQLQQYLNQYMAPDAEISTLTDLYIGDRHVATTAADATEESVAEALGFAASALQGRRLVSDYELEIDVTDYQIMPGQTTARVRTVIQESGIFGGPVARQVAQRIGEARERIGEARERIGEMRRQRQQMQEDSGQMGQFGQRMQQGMGQMQDGQQGMSMGIGPGRGGGVLQQGLPFQTRATCSHILTIDNQDQIHLGDTFCRGTMRISLQTAQ